VQSWHFTRDLTGEQRLCRDGGGGAVVPFGLFHACLRLYACLQPAGLHDLGLPDAGLRHACLHHAHLHDAGLRLGLLPHPCLHHGAARLGFFSPGFFIFPEDSSTRRRRRKVRTFL
jgi:hypothetical protein